MSTATSYGSKGLLFSNRPIQELIDTGHTVNCVPIFQGWREVDSFEEYQQAWAKIRS